MDRPILTNDHETERHTDPTALEHENAELKRILGLRMHMNNETHATYSGDELAYAMPVTVRRDGLGNVQLELES